jgi:hypothetical protein
MRERFFSGDREFKEIHTPDPVISGVYRYEDGDWAWEEPLQGSRPTAMDSSNKAKPPVCEEGCRYRQAFSGFDRQQNALRMETTHLIATDRCGWNIKPGRLGGHPLDYAPCTFSPND